jgi:hypothetical protein
LLDACVTLWQKFGLAESEWGGEAWARLDLGHAAIAGSQHHLAKTQFEAALQLHTRVRAVDGMAMACLHLGYTALRQSTRSAAASYFKRSLRLFQEAGAKYGVGLALAGLYDVFTTAGQTRHAAIMAGAAMSALPADEAGLLRPSEQAPFERMRAAAVANSTSAAVEDARRFASRLSITQAIALALSAQFELT